MALWIFQKEFAAQPSLLLTLLYTIYSTEEPLQPKSAPFCFLFYIAAALSNAEGRLGLNTVAFAAFSCTISFATTSG